MTIGEHLDELRSCLVRSVLAFVLACLVCIWPSKYLLQLIVRPLVLALRKYQQPESLLATGPVETVLIYVKVVLFAGLVISAPYIIYQVWNFVATGLYKHEKMVVHRIVPISTGLFLAGVVFMYLFVLLLALKFLVGFSGWLPLPQARPTALDRVLLGGDELVVPSTQPAIVDAPTVPIFSQDPKDPPVGTVWFNLVEQKLKFQGAKERFSTRLLKDTRRAMVTTHFRIGEYLTFVLVLTVAFGLAFQMPLVVVFLVRAGIVDLETFKKYRKVVILVIVILAGMIAPADLMSHAVLSGAMIVLFELGLVFARKKPEPDASQ